MPNRAETFLLKNRKTLLWILGLLLLYFLVFHNLTRFPEPWFDEGSHLHVPKTLVKYGVYADISSEGFRYYGPTIGVGPTIMLPIAAAFKLFGIGLLQARLVMALYLLAALYMFYRLVEHLAGKRLAWIALALLLSSRSVLFLQYGRQLLGEVPGFFFILLALYLWFSRWNENDWKRLALIGLFFGLAMITKYQYLLFLAPALILSWLLDIFYYKTSTHRNFLIPGIVAAASFGIWQLLTLQYLGPSTALENLALLRASAEKAAFNFSLTQIDANFEELTARAVYLGTAFPAFLYGFLISLPRTREGQKWSVLFLLMALNLVWFVVASIGWIRYAFLGLSLSSVFIARLFWALTDGFHFDWSAGRLRSLFEAQNAPRIALSLWLIAIIVMPLCKTMLDIAAPPPPYAMQMAAYLNENIPLDAVIETWEPEMGFLTDHNYHYPPNALLAVAVDHVYYEGEPVQEHYNFIQTEKPPYLLVGIFSKWTEIYPLEELKEHDEQEEQEEHEELSGQYELIATFGDYDLYRRVEK
ncbi:MAG: ArnT family glycosyltransferase [Chloroflexota bacterium]|nr:glycosyltransferase family 39 protein [Chloroflexota bacterium]MBI5702019.1 glycosyltransferase family 39 protein [Chloroflexota bacterium]